MKLIRKPSLYVDAVFLALAFLVGVVIAPMLGAQPLDVPAAAPLAPSSVNVDELVTVGTSILAWGLTWLWTRFGPKVPRMVILAMPLVVSGIVMSLGAWFHGTPVGSWQNIVGTILSAALAVFGNEIKSTGAQHGLTGKG